MSNSLHDLKPEHPADPYAHYQKMDAQEAAAAILKDNKGLGRYIWPDANFDHVTHIIQAQRAAAQEAIQQALTEQTAEVAALREALGFYANKNNWKNAEIIIGPFMVGGSESWAERTYYKRDRGDYARNALTQPNPRAQKIMAVVEAVKKLASLRKRLQESTAIKPDYSDFWPLMHELADMGEALEGGAQ